MKSRTCDDTSITGGHLQEYPESYVERIFAYAGDTGLFNQTGQPGISLPLHWTDNNLPVGMMFTAAYRNDAFLLQLATQLEHAQPWWNRCAPNSTV